MAPVGGYPWAIDRGWRVGQMIGGFLKSTIAAQVRTGRPDRGWASIWLLVWPH